MQKESFVDRMRQQIDVMTPIALRVHHVVNFVYWIRDGWSDRAIKKQLKQNKYNKESIERTIEIFHRLKNPEQRIFILGFRDVKHDSVCGSCTVKRITDLCDLPSGPKYGDRDADDAVIFNVEPSVVPVKIGDLMEIRQHYVRE